MSIYGRVNRMSIHTPGVDRAGTTTDSTFHPGTRDIDLLSRKAIQNLQRLTPYMLFQSKKKAVTVTDPEYGQFNHEWMPEKMAMTWSSGTYVLDATTPVALNASTFGDNVKCLNIGDVGCIESNDLTATGMYGSAEVIVTNIDRTTGVVTVMLSSPNHPGASEAASGRTLSAASKHWWYRQGSAFNEVSEAPDGVHLIDSLRKNYTQQFRTAYEFSNKYIRILKHRNQNYQVAKQIAQRMEEHQREMEYANLFSPVELSGRSGDGATRTKTRGLLGELTNWKIVIEGGISHGDLSIITEAAFSQVTGSGKKVAFAPPRVIRALREALQDKTQITRISDKLGFGYNVWECDHGIVDIYTSPLYNGRRLALGPQVMTSTGYNDNWMIIVDPADLEMVTFEPTHREMIVQANGNTSTKGEFITEVGCNYLNPMTGLMVTWEGDQLTNSDKFNSYGTSELTYANYYTK